jgi:hypothetical protein
MTREAMISRARRPGIVLRTPPDRTSSPKPVPLGDDPAATGDDLTEPDLTVP